jgi:hypothetical protein
MDPPVAVVAEQVAMAPATVTGAAAGDAPVPAAVLGLAAVAGPLAAAVSTPVTPGGRSRRSGQSTGGALASVAVEVAGALGTPVLVVAGTPKAAAGASAAQGTPVAAAAAEGVGPVTEQNGNSKDVQKAFQVHDLACSLVRRRHEIIGGGKPAYGLQRSKRHYNDEKPNSTAVKGQKRVFRVLKRGQSKSRQKYEKSRAMQFARGRNMTALFDHCHDGSEPTGGIIVIPGVKEVPDDVIRMVKTFPGWRAIPSDKGNFTSESYRDEVVAEMYPRLFGCSNRDYHFLGYDQVNLHVSAKTGANTGAVALAHGLILDAYPPEISTWSSPPDKYAMSEVQRSNELYMDSLGIELRRRQKTLRLSHRDRAFGIITGVCGLTSKTLNAGLRDTGFVDPEHGGPNPKLIPVEAFACGGPVRKLLELPSPRNAKFMKELNEEVNFYLPKSYPFFLRSFDVHPLPDFLSLLDQNTSVAGKTKNEPSGPVMAAAVVRHVKETQAMQALRHVVDAQAEEIKDLKEKLANSVPKKVKHVVAVSNASASAKTPGKQRQLEGTNLSSPYYLEAQAAKAAAKKNRGGRGRTTTVTKQESITATTMVSSAPMPLGSLPVSPPQLLLHSGDAASIPTSPQSGPCLPANVLNFIQQATQMNIMMWQQAQQSQTWSTTSTPEHDKENIAPPQSSKPRTVFDIRASHGN